MIPGDSFHPHDHRLNPNSDLSATELRLLQSATDSFGIDACAYLRLNGGFSGSSVFRVTTASSESFVIRLTPLDSAIASDRLSLLQQLLSCVSDLGQHGIPVPLKPRVHFENATSIEAHIGACWCVIGDFRITAEPWIHGEPIASVPTTHQIASSVDYIHTLHKRLRLAASKLTRNEWFFVRSGVSSGLKRRSNLIDDLAKGDLRRLKEAFINERDPEFQDLAFHALRAVEYWIPWLTRKLSELLGVEFSLQPAVRDLWRPHVLFSEGMVTGVIDLTSAASEHPAMDFARLFRSWFDADHSSLCKAFQQMATAYRLGTQERQLFQTFDACSTLLSPMTWLRRRIGSSMSGDHENEIRERLRQLVQVALAFQPIDVA
jgi:hypothetical protein